MVKNVMTLQRTFDPGLSNFGARIVVIKPYDVVFEIEYDAKKDADNPVLHKDLNRLWNAFCKVRAVKFQKEVEATVKLLWVRLEKMQKAGTVQTDAAATARTLEAMLATRNVKMSDGFDKWIEGYIREVTKTVNAWGSVNNDARLIKAKRGGRVVKDIAGITHSLINPLSIKGKIKIFSKIRTLYKDAKASYGNADKRARRVLSEIASLQKVLNTMEAHQKSGKMIKWVSKFNSIGDDLKRAVDAYEDEVKVLKSTVKKLGAKVRDLQDSDEPGASNEVEKAVAKLAAAESALRGHVIQLGASQRKFEEMKVDNNLFSLNDKLRAKLKESLKKKLDSGDKAIRAEISTMSKVTVFDAEIATLENGLKVNARGALIQI